MKLSFLESTNPLTNMKKIISVSYQHSLRQRHKTDLIHSQKLNPPTFNFNWALSDSQRMSVSPLMDCFHRRRDVYRSPSGA